MSNDTAENVLILQGGGSLGAFGCGVFKALASNNIKIDIVAGTSIGGLNATIIAGSKGDHPERNNSGWSGKQYEFKVACFNSRFLLTHTYLRVDTVLLWFSISWK
jgi:predicted acylesterase/phospholipase RssA